MSTCPAKDIHCLYADNELQEPFKTEFEMHTASCGRCQKIVSEYRSLRAKMQSISDTDFYSDSGDHAQFEEGYARLKARLSYKKVVLPEKRFTMVHTFIPAAAAAAVFILTAVFTLRLANTKFPQNQVYSPAAVSKSRVEPIQKRGIIAPENVSTSALASMFGTRYQFTLDTPQLTAIDVFKPELSTNVHDIRIPLTDVSQMPLISASPVMIRFAFTEDPFR